MGVGSIKHTGSPVPEIIYIGKGSGTIAAGDVVAFDSSGLVIPATASTLAPHGVLTDLLHVVGSTTYYGVLMGGYIVCKAGAAIKPNKLVMSDANQDVIASVQTVSSTYVQAESLAFWYVMGRYVRLESDNTYAPSDAANTNAVIVSVGGIGG